MGLNTKIRVTEEGYKAVVNPNTQGRSRAGEKRRDIWGKEATKEDGIIK